MLPQHPPTLPPLYRLPHDLRQVKVIAYALAVGQAYQCYEHGELASADDPTTVERMTTAACTSEQMRVSQGRRGTDDAGLFAEVFCAVYLHAFPAMLSRFIERKYCIASGLSERERLKLFCEYARCHLQEIEELRVWTEERAASQ